MGKLCSKSFLTMKKEKLLIIGKIPPPIGGVTIHVSRSLLLLENRGVTFDHFSPSSRSIFSLLHKIIKYKVVHLHSSSNVFFRFFISVCCVFARTQLILTIHGDWGLHKGILKIIDNFSIYFAKCPVLLNKNSLKRASRINKNSIYITSFIPPLFQTELPLDVKTRLKRDRIKKNKIFSTNAYNLSFNSNGKEIYGITDLIRIFTNIKNSVLYISDPSGNYLKYVVKLGIEIPENIYFINFPHDYSELLKHVDCMIRNTTTDGDSISVKEALYFNTIVLASNAIERPKGVQVYNSEKELIFHISNLENLYRTDIHVVSAEDELINLYNTFL